jgi:hypothetical protein
LRAQRKENFSIKGNNSGQARPGAVHVKMFSENFLSNHCWANQFFNFEANAAIVSALAAFESKSLSLPERKGNGWLAGTKADECQCTSKRRCGNEKLLGCDDKKKPLAGLSAAVSNCVNDLR